MHAIGIDIGTTSLCAVLLDAESGRTLRTVTRSTGGFLPADEPDARIQDAAAIVSAASAIYRELTDQFGPADAVGVTGQMHGIVYTDEAGRPVSPLYTWQDGRGNRPYRDGLSYAGWLRSASGLAAQPGYGAVTHLYLTENGLLPPRAVRFGTICDLVAMALGGASEPLVHASNAASLGLYSRSAGDFDRAAIRRCGMDPSFFPAVTGLPRVLGRTAQGAPVLTAIGDNQASVFGSVRDVGDTVLVNIGTGSQVSCGCAPETVCPGAETRPYLEGDALLVGAALCGGRAFASLEKLFREIAENVTGRPVDSAYPAMNRALASFTPPASPLAASTLLCGTRTDPTLRGSITNISTENWTMASLCDAFTRGMAEELHGLYETMLPRLPRPARRLVASGNAVRSSPALCRALEELFGMELSMPAMTEEASFGAALAALVYTGRLDRQTAAGLIRYTR